MIPVIYLTGAAACGKGTLGKMLAEEFGFLHISIGDILREYRKQRDSLNPKLPPNWPESARQAIIECMKNNKPIPDNILHTFPGLLPPVVLVYHNYHVKNDTQDRKSKASWLTPQIMLENMKLAEGRYKALLVDGLPVTPFERNVEVINHFGKLNSGLTIVITCPVEVARERYLNRARMASENEAKFARRMEKTERILPQFIKFMEEQGTVVTAINDGTLSVEEAYRELFAKLSRSEVFWGLIGKRPGRAGAISE
ncbi:P-loop containing nucleoside triphosphate hydrolase protein [Poronia punctata]|nr:P-loop containing nucleoside triphosphate hydrolase protein [Poronia punctata]